MMKIEAIIKPFKLEEVQAALTGLGVQDVVISGVVGGEGRLGSQTFYRGAEYRVNAPRMKLEILVSSLHVDEVVDAVSLAARTTAADDDGVILVSEVAEAINIRDGRALRTPR